MEKEALIKELFKTIYGAMIDGKYADHITDHEMFDLVHRILLHYRINYAVVDKNEFELIDEFMDKFVNSYTVATVWGQHGVNIPLDSMVRKHVTEFYRKIKSA